MSTKNYEPSLDGCYAGMNELPDDMKGWLRRGLESAVREQAAMNKFRLSEIALRMQDCSACSLRLGRNKSVPGEGNPQAKVIFCGEAPGRTENETGRPFVGRAGKLLDNMIKSIV